MYKQLHHARNSGIAPTATCLGVRLPTRCSQPDSNSQVETRKTRITRADFRWVFPYPYHHQYRGPAVHVGGRQDREVARAFFSISHALGARSPGAENAHRAPYRIHEPGRNGGGALTAPQFVGASTAFAEL